MSESLELPPKPEVALALLQTAMSLYVHLDPRSEGVRVPPWFKKQPQLVLQVGLNMPVPIPDLDVGEEALSCTLSFNRRPEFCWIPWDAIYGLVGEDGRGMIWPDSVPPEVAAAADGRARPKAEGKRPRLRAVGSEAEASGEAEAALEPEAAVEAGAEPAEDGGEARVAEPTPTVAEEPPAVEPTPAAASSKSGSKRELPSYLRVVK